MGFLAAMHNLKRYEATSSSSSSRGSSSGHSGRSLDSSGSESESGDATLSQGCLDFSRSLTLNQLTSMEVEQTGKGEATRKNGQDPERIKMVLTQGACQCNRKCHRRVSFKILLSVCIAFWSLTKGAQDCLLPACSYINLLFPYIFPFHISHLELMPKRLPQTVPKQISLQSGFTHPLANQGCGVSRTRAGINVMKPRINLMMSPRCPAAKTPPRAPGGSGRYKVGCETSLGVEHIYVK